ncbi:invasion associated locus B family protein [Telmatospirillum sp.]|uniref:invasion associated locus B family protein n=1 Tax=Telmatospirillum sp. TaxID=2079197 RepID=UPI00284FD53D|nr:invasion associated locus B family protein [Telmatospirillum sp.]MDR3435505.1 invasion associated locus B family protein [Telmatospirillum sp.]
MKTNIVLAAALAAAAVAGVIPAAGKDAKEVASPAKPDSLWSKQCVKSPEGKDACFVQQFAIDTTQNTPVLRVAFSYLGPEGKPRLELTAPLGILLTAGLKMTIDERPPLTLPLQFCQAGGCLAVVDLDQQALDQFRNGKSATVEYVTLDRKARVLPVKLEGLVAALKTVTP